MSLRRLASRQVCGLSPQMYQVGRVARTCLHPRRAIVSWLKQLGHSVRQAKLRAAEPEVELPGPRSNTPEEAQATVTHMRHLLEQDPYRRIRLIPTRENHKTLYSYLASKSHESVERLGPVVSIEAHCLPFWTVTNIAWLCHQATSPSTGTSSVALRAGMTSLMTEVGFSVAAVADDHWASGVVMVDSARSLQFTLQSRLQDELIDSGDSSQLTTSALERRLRDHVFDPSTAPPFAKGYPAFSDYQFQRLYGSAMNAHLKSKPSWVITTKLNAPLDTMAFPTYRIVYAIKYAKGETAFCDGNRAVSAEPDAGHRHHFVLPDSPPRYNRTYDPSQLFSEYVNWRHYKGQRGVGDPEICRISLGESKEDAFRVAKAICDVTAGSQLNWTDPRILPADLGAGSANLSAVVKYEVQRITNDQLRPAPQFPISLPESNSTKVKDPRRSFVRPIARPARPARPNPQPSSTGSSRSTPPQRPALKPPLTRYTRRVPLPASQPPPIQVLDRAGYYAHLEVAPDWTYLSEQHEKQVSAVLAETRRTQLAVYHPDVGDGDMTMLVKRSQDINVAFASLNTLEKRKRYQAGQVD